MTEAKNIEDELFDILENKAIKTEGGNTIIVTTKEDLHITPNDADLLEYYDSGLFSSAFGESTCDVFDVTEGE